MEGFLLGKVSDAEAERLERHLPECSICSAVRRDLKTANPVITAVQARQAVLPQPEKEIVQELNGLPPPGEAPTQDSSAKHHLDTCPSAEDAQDICDLLGKPQAPDEIGRLGPYRVFKVLGTGGMGVVLQAEDPQLKRLVALKVMKPAFAAVASARKRFLREAQAAAAIAHVHIVTIHQVGEDRGVPFIAMQFLQGESLAERLVRENVLPLPEVLRIGRQIAEGLAVAHEHGLIHRDIKPANIWLEAGKCTVKILDFGLARAVGDDTHLTQSGAIVGTPAFMAPEQAQGWPVDHRCDLFSLGCVLYRMATGRAPFRGTDTMSTLLAVVTEQPVPPRSINPNVPPALSDLVVRLLAKSAADRPQTAQEAADALADMERPLDHRASSVPAMEVAAAPPKVAAVPSPGGRKRRWRGYGLRAAVVLVALLPLAYWFGPAVLRFATNRGVLVIETGDAGIEVTFKDQVGRVFDPNTKREIELTAGDQEIQVRELPDGLRFFTKQFTLTRGGKESLNVRLELAQVKPPTETSKTPPGSSFDALKREDIPAYELAVAGGGDPKQAPAELVAILGDSRLKHWRAVYAVAFSPDGKVLVSGGYDYTVKLWDPTTGNEIRSLSGQSTWSVALSPDGKLVASGGDNDTVKLREMATGKEVGAWLAQKGYVNSLAFSPSGQVLASGGNDGTIKLWQAGSWEEQLSLGGQQGKIQCVVFSPDGKLLASGNGDSTVTLWDPATGEVRRTLKGHSKTVNAVAFSPDNRILASGSGDQTVRLWDVATGKELRQVSAKGASYSVAFSPDGRFLAFGGGEDRGAVVQLLELAATKAPRTLTRHDGSVTSVAFSPDGKLLASGSMDFTVKIWDLEAGKARHDTAGQFGNVRGVAISPDGKLLASASAGTVTLWAAATGKQSCILDKEEAISVAFSPDGKSLACGLRNVRVKLWDVALRKPLRILSGHKGSIHAVAFSADGKLLAGAGDKTVTLWDTATGQPLRKLEGHQEQVTAVAFSPDGKLLASGSRDTTVRLWEVAAGKELRTWKRDSAVLAVAFSPDGKTLVSGEPYWVTLWDPTTGAVLRDLKGGASALAFDGAGRLLAAGYRGEISIWHPDTGIKQRAIRLAAGGDINQVAFSPDGRHLATANGNGTVYILRLAPLPATAAK